MITLYRLTCELGCTLADLDTLGVLVAPAQPDSVIGWTVEDDLRAAWIDAHGGIDA